MSEEYWDAEGGTNISVADKGEIFATDDRYMRVFLNLSPADMRALALDLNEAADKKEFGA